MQPVTVTVRDGKPLHFVYKQQTISVEQIADFWRETGRWWDGEIAQDFFLINAASGTFLLARTTATGMWYAKPVQ